MGMGFPVLGVPGIFLDYLKGHNQSNVSETDVCVRHPCLK